MKSKATPWTHTGVTSEEITTEFGASGSTVKHTVTVPARTRCVKLEGGTSTWVVQDLTFLPNKNSIEYHDADHYGIRISEEKIADIQPVNK